MATELKIDNAVITKAEITNDDQGVLTAWVYTEFGAGGCGFGGFSLYLPTSFDSHKINSGYAGHFIWRVMEVAGVTEWSKLAGKNIRIKHEGLGGGIVAIGHIIKDDWFDPKIEFAK